MLIFAVYEGFSAQEMFFFVFVYLSSHVLRVYRCNPQRAQLHHFPCLLTSPPLFLTVKRFSLSQLENLSDAHSKLCVLYRFITMVIGKKFFHL